MKTRLLAVFLFIDI